MLRANRVFVASKILSILLIWVGLLPLADLSLGDSSALTLAEAVNKTLAQSKELESFSWELRANDGKILQAGAIPNPQLTFNPENFTGSKFFRQQIQNTVEVSQLIELGGKRESRVRVAESEKDKSLSDYEIKRNKVLADLNQRFIQVLSDQEMLKLMRRATKLAEQMLETVRSRSHAGSGANYEEPRTRVMVARARIDEEHSEHELLSSRKLLALSWNEEELNLPLSGNLLHSEAPPTLSELNEKLESSPAILQGRAEERLRQAILSLAEAKRVPDVTVGVGWRSGRSLDEQAAVASITVPLQIFDRNQGGIAEAAAISLGSKVQSETLPVRMRATVFELFQEIKHAKTELDLMAAEIIPQSEKALSFVQEGYKIGRYSFLELTEAHTAVIENHAAQIKAALTFHKLSIEMNQLLGGPSHEDLH